MNYELHINQNVFYVYEEKLCYTDKEKYKIRYHCHFTGKYSSAAHSICDLRHAIAREVSVVIHNRLNYNDHFIIKQFGTIG